ncbi:MAG: FG-GAP-like repeat-containing protein [Bacteroidota bacterium]
MRFLKCVLFGLLLMTASQSFAQKPTITSFSPVTGDPGTAVTITGTNFSATPASNIVYFGNVKASVSSSTTTTLNVTVPIGATHAPIRVIKGGLQATSAASFRISFTSSGVVDAASFSTKADFAAVDGPTSPIAADIDGDGKLDLVVPNGAGGGGTILSIYRNTSTPGSLTTSSFAAKVDFTTGNTPNMVAVGDLDGDGKLDVVTCNYNGSSVSVFRNTSTAGSITTSSLAASIDYSIGFGSRSVTLADLDGDGKPEIIATSVNDNNISVLKNNSTSGTISFATKVDFTTAVSPWFVAAGDLDGDNKIDLAVATSDGNAVSLFRNTSTVGVINSASFAARYDLPLGTYGYYVEIIDLNLDGKKDLYTRNNFYTNQISSPGAFSASSFIGTSLMNYGNATGELNGDGWPDVLAENFTTGNLAAWINKKSTGQITSDSFTQYSDFPVGSIAGYIIADLDGDKKSDIAVTNFTANTVSIMRNLADLPKITGLSATTGIAGSSITINGSSFSAVPADNIVYFGAAKATVTSSNFNSITVTVPTGASYGPVSVTVGGYTATSLQSFDLTFPSAQVFGTNTFAPKLALITLESEATDLGRYPQDLVVADLDLDGKPDLASANNWGSLTIFRNTSSGGSLSFGPKANTGLSFGIPGMASGDIDGDGLVDFVIPQSSGSYVIALLRNTSTPGTISFAPEVDITMGVSNGDGIIADFDNDGRPDLAITAPFNAGVYVFKNIGAKGSITTASFSASVSFATATNPTGIVVGDFNGDGWKDLAISCGTSNTVSILRNTGSGLINSGLFAAHSDISLAVGTAPSAITIGDLDVDTKQDLLICNHANGTVSILRNTTTASTITFASVVNITTSPAPQGVSVGDLDGDGKPEFVVTQKQYPVQVFKNNTTPGTLTAASFSSTSYETIGSEAYTPAIVDLNGDGKPEIAVIAQSNQEIDVLRNTIGFVEPSAQPTSFTSTVISKSQINLTFTNPTSIANASGYIILRRQDGSFPSNVGVVDGFLPSSLTLPIGTTYAGSSTAATFNNTSLTPGVTYRYAIIPYNSNGVDAGTYNYKTDGVILTSSALTLPDNLADIVYNSGFTAPTNIAYKNFQATDITSGSSVDVAKFTIRDKGVSASDDLDAYPTILNAITFSITNPASIRKVAIYSDAGVELAESAPSGSTVSFTGFTYSAADNGTKDLFVKATFNGVVTDNQQFAFTITSAAVATSSSTFTATNAGGATSSVVGDANRIEVTASKLVYTTQPPSLLQVNTNLSPSPVLEARDDLNNKDLDFGSTVTVTNSATLTMSTLPTGFTAGLLTFPAGFKFTTPGQTQLSVASGGVTTAVSNSIVVRASEPSSPPGAITFTNRTNTSQKVSFTAAPGPPDGYLILRKQASSVDDAPTDGIVPSGTLGTSTVLYSGPLTSFDDSGLTSGVQYTYKVFSYNGAAAAINYNITGVSASTFTLTDAPVLSAPTNVTQTSFELNWAPVNGASGYLLDVSKDAFATFVTGYAGKSISTTNTVVDGLEAGVEYKVRLRGSLISGVSANSNVITQATVPATPAANPGTGITQTGFTASWPAIAGAQSYELDVSLDDFATFATGYNAKSTTTTSVAVAGLTPGLTYKYRVRSSNGKVSPSSVAVSVLLIPATPVAVDPTLSTIKASEFVAVWNDVTGESGYEIDVSADGFITFLPGLQAKSIEANTLLFQVTGLTSNTTYYYRVRALNASGTSPNSNTIPTSTISVSGSNALTISNNGPFTSTLPDGFISTNLSVTAQNGTDTKHVVLKYKGIMDDNFHSLDSVIHSGDNYTVTIRESRFDALGLEYYFEVTDDVQTKTQASHYFIYRSILSTTNKAIPFAAGFDGTAETYQMFSVPYVLADENIANLFDPVFKGPDKEVWRLFHYQNQATEEYPEQVKKIEPGKGYWFNTRSKEFQVKLGTGTVQEVTSDESTAFKMLLDQGWNQVGNPYPFKISWAAVVDGNADISNLAFFSNGTYDDSNDTFAPWKGAFVFADKQTTLPIPISARVTGGGRIASNVLPTEIDGSEWMLPIEISAQNIVRKSGVGMHPQANMSKDKFDRIKLPAFSQYIDLVTQHPDFFAPDFTTDVVPTAKTHEWTFYINTNLDGAEATLTWDLPSIAHSTSSLIIVDMQNQTWVDMKVTDRYTFKASHGQSLKIFYNSNGDIEPGVTLLGDAYPNPFSGDVRIPILNGEPGDVTIEVYNLLGQRLRTLTRNSVRGGPVSIDWDGKDDSGIDVPSGILLYRLPDVKKSVKRLVKK